MQTHVWKRIFHVSLFVMLLTGCGAVPHLEASVQDAPIAANTDQTRTTVTECLAEAPADPVQLPAAETPYDYMNMQTDVVIQLDEEPRLQSPIQTFVGVTPQTYTLYFRQPMNRVSVEKSIQTNAEAKDQPPEQSAKPQFTFQWTSDRQLHLLVKAALTEPTSEEGERRYLLDVAGAKTQTGAILKEAPTFLANLQKPEELWMISADGQQQKQIAVNKEPYSFYQPEIFDPRYLMMERSTQYCQCDAEYPMLYALYDLTNRNWSIYPVELTTNYWGEGDFIADTRGFFYNKPADDVKIPDTSSAKHIQVEGFVHGGNFSKDRTHLFLAVGTKEQEKDYDLILYDLATDKQKHYPGVIKGEGPYNEATGAEIGTNFHDNGKTVTFNMYVPEKYEEIRYQYDWQSGKISKWNPPIPLDTWSGYTASADNKYQLYANGGLYQGQQVLNERMSDCLWLGDTHQSVMSISSEQTTEQFPHTGLYLYDADKRVSKQISDSAEDVLGTSPDGKWIYTTR